VAADWAEILKAESQPTVPAINEELARYFRQRIRERDEAPGNKVARLRATAQKVLDAIEEIHGSYGITGITSQDRQELRNALEDITPAELREPVKYTYEQCLENLSTPNATSEGSPPSRLENKQERTGDSLH
jgi:hypothetical protein